MHRKKMHKKLVVVCVCQGTTNACCIYMYVCISTKNTRTHTHLNAAHSYFIYIHIYAHIYTYMYVYACIYAIIIWFFALLLPSPTPPPLPLRIQLNFFCFTLCVIFCFRTLLLCPTPVGGTRWQMCKFSCILTDDSNWDAVSDWILFRHFFLNAFLTHAAQCSGPESQRLNVLLM